jgi:formylglycine-generating enzyme required for sulfatase activity
MQELVLSDSGRRGTPDARAAAIIGVGDQRTVGNPLPLPMIRLGASRASGGVKTDVTNGQFAKFVKATGCVTITEKPSSADFPGALPENLFAGGVVFAPPDHAVALDNNHEWWSYVKGADWRHPTGPKSSIKEKRLFPSSKSLTLRPKPMRTGLTSNPTGPDTPLDPAEPSKKEKVHRGGSFLCTDQYCSRYMVGTRGKGEVSTGTNHLGFRCVTPSSYP